MMQILYQGYFPKDFDEYDLFYWEKKKSGSSRAIPRMNDSPSAITEEVASVSCEQKNSR